MNITSRLSKTSGWASHKIITHRSFQFGSVQDGIYALGKAHMRSTPPLRISPNVTFETVRRSQKDIVCHGVTNGFLAQAQPVLNIDDMKDSCTFATSLRYKNYLKKSIGTTD